MKKSTNANSIAQYVYFARSTHNAQRTTHQTDKRRTTHGRTKSTNVHRACIQRYICRMRNRIKPLIFGMTHILILLFVCFFF